MTRYDLPVILYDSIKDMGGHTTIIEVCKYIWRKYKTDLQESGDLFFCWQYDIRWAATELRKTGRMKSTELSPRGIWEII